MQIVVRHETLTPNIAATVSLGVDADYVEVLNRGAFDLYFTIDGTTPTIGGNDVEIVPAGTALEVSRKAPGNATVKLVAPGSVAFTVRGVKR